MGDKNVYSLVFDYLVRWVSSIVLLSCNREIFDQIVSWFGCEGSP